MIAWWLLSACHSVETLRQDISDAVCRDGEENCVPVTPGFIEERFENLAEIARLRQALDACESVHHQSRLVSFEHEQFKCTVRGSLYVNQGAGQIIERVDGCNMIQMKLIDNGIELKYGGRWVLIPVPMNGGHMQFGYRWGSLVATIGGKEYPISWGYE